MTDKLTKWEPKQFDGSDLLPVEAASQAPLGPSSIPVVGGYGDPDDLIMPALKLLQGTSEEVQKGDIEEAKPGKFFLTSTGDVIEPPLRVLVIHHHKGNALFINSDEAKELGLEMCISKDGQSGTVYGECEQCRKCLDWRTSADGKNRKPLGSRTHHYTLLTSMGMAQLRCANTSYKAGKKFYSAKETAIPPRNYWAHPTVLRTHRETNAEGKPYFVLDMTWDRTETVPDTHHEAAFNYHEKINEAFLRGRLGSQEDARAPD